jgi:hypothetical protein
LTRPSFVRTLGIGLTAAAVAAAVVTAGPATAAKRARIAWAPAASATVHPGVQTFTDGAQCTANFVYTDGTNVYLGQAAHCSGTGAATDTNGCDSATLPLGTPVKISGASKPGKMVYNSWIAMQKTGEKDQETCDYNDLALVQVDPADVGKVNPSVPFWGGPTGLDTNGTQPGETVLTYGNSELRLGVTALSPKQGISLGDSPRGWSRDVYTVTPGIPGDSGSGFLSADGTALGVLSTVQIAPLAGSNGVGDLAKELAYMHTHSSFAGVQLARGTEAFTGPLL